MATISPLHILSYAIEYHFYGLNPKGYHATSLVLFLIACVLICWFILLLSNNKNIAIITVALYGLNAMRVESAAWAAERKDLLYVVFIPSLIAYIKYIQKNVISILFLSVLFFLPLLSILSKVMAASIIGPLIMLDYYYARKFLHKVAVEKYHMLHLQYGGNKVRKAAETNTIDTSHVFLCR